MNKLRGFVITIIFFAAFAEEAVKEAEEASGLKIEGWH